MMFFSDFISLRNLADAEKNPFAVANKHYAKLQDVCESQLFLHSTSKSDQLEHTVRVLLLPHQVLLIPSTYAKALIKIPNTIRIYTRLEVR